MSTEDELNAILSGAPIDPAGPPSATPSGKGDVLSELSGILGDAPEAVGAVVSSGPGRTVGKGLGVIGWPFMRISETLSAVPVGALDPKTTMVQELGKAARGFNPLGEKVENPPTFSRAFEDYYRRVVREEPPGFYGPVAGFGADILATGGAAKLVGKGAVAGTKALKVPERLEKANPLALRKAMLTRKAAMAGQRDVIEEVSKGVSRKAATDIAKEITRKTGKTITPNAVERRLTQIIQGSVSSEGPAGRLPGVVRPANPIVGPLLNKPGNAVIDEFQSAAKELRALGLLGDTQFSKLTKAQVVALKAKRATLRSTLGKLDINPDKKTLLRYAESLKVKGNEPLANSLIRIAEQVEAGDTRYIKGLSSLLDANDAQLAAIRVRGRGKVVQDLWQTMSDMNKTEPKRLDALGRILNIDTKKPGALRRMVERYQNVNAGERSRIMKRIGKAADDLLDVDVAGINHNKLGPYANRIMAIRDKEGQRIVGALVDRAAKAESLGVTGKGPLIKHVERLNRRFPGRTSLKRTLQGQVDDIDRRLFQDTHLGSKEYFPRLYETKEAEALARKFPLRAGPKIKRQYAKQRQDIPEEIRKQLGEIKYPSYPAAKRLAQESHDIETAKMFNKLAKNPALVSDTPKPGFAKKPLPETKSYGALAGKYVHPRVAGDVQGLVGVKTDFGRMYDSVIGSWKMGKTVFNPATHFRNMISNTMLLDASGMDHLEQARYLPRALKDIKRGAKEWKTAKNYFGGSTFTHGEMLDDMLRASKTPGKGGAMARIADRVDKTTSWAARKPGAVYQNEELLAKYMKYLQQRDKGASVIDSVMEANKWLFDYSDLTQFEKVVARRAMPFYTFPRKVVPRMAEAIATRPMAMQKYPAAAWGMTKLSLNQLELTEKDYAKIEKDLPKYMEKGSYMLMPLRDKNGDLQFFDWTYTVPWGIFADVQQRGAADVLVTNPGVQVTGDLMRNKSSFTDRPIWQDTDTKKEKWIKGLLYTWEAAAPPLVGLYGKKIKDAFLGRPSKYGKQPSVGKTLAQTIFGLRVQAVDVEVQRQMKLRGASADLREMAGKMADITIRRNSGNISEKEYRKRYNGYIRQIGEMVEDINE